MKRWSGLRACLIGLATLAAMTGISLGGNLADTYGPGWQSLPDWRGVWYLEGPLLFPGPGHSVIAKSGRVPKPFEYGVAPGSYFQGAPYKPEYQKLYDERLRKARARGIVEDPVDTCYIPHGMPRLMGAGPLAVEFLVTPKETWMIWDFLNQTRRIYTDGRGHPSEDQRWPRTMGHSVGHWEGRTLIVDTVWMMEGIYDRSGAPHSDQLHLTERITRTDAKTLTADMTIEDPVMFTGPWQVTRRFKKSPQKWVSVPGTYCAYEDRQPIRAE